MGVGESAARDKESANIGLDPRGKCLRILPPVPDAANPFRILRGAGNKKTLIPIGMRTSVWRGRDSANTDYIHAANANAFGHRYAMWLPAFESCAKWHEVKKQAELACFFTSRHAGFEPATYRFVAGHSIHWASSAFRSVLGTLIYNTTLSLFCQYIKTFFF